MRSLPKHKSGRDWKRRALIAPAAVLTIVLLVAPISGSPVSTRFPGATWSGDTFTDAIGCSRMHHLAPKFSIVTGNGSWAGWSSSRTCSASRGGPTNSSATFLELGYSVSAPINMTTGPGGVNATFELKVWGSQSTHVPSSICPATTGYFYGAAYYPTYDCVVQATLSIYAFAYLVDVTHRPTIVAYSSSWPGINSSSGLENFSYPVNTTNGTTIVTSNSSLGGSASISGNYAPTFFLNGSAFNSTHKYDLIAIIYADQSTYAYGYPSGATARTTLDLAGSGHANLRVKVW